MIFQLSMKALESLKAPTTMLSGLVLVPSEIAVHLIPTSFRWKGYMPRCEHTLNELKFTQDRLENELELELNA